MFVVLSFHTRKCNAVAAAQLLAALVLAALMGLVYSSTNAHAAPADPLPCDPTNSNTNRCLTVEPFITEHLNLRAAGDGLIFAMASSPGEPQLRVLDAATLATRGVLPFADAPLLYEAGFVYTASTLPVTDTGQVGLVVGVGAVDRPTLLGSFALSATRAVDWASSSGAIYMLAASSAGDANELRTYSLAQPAHPSVSTILPDLHRSRLLVQGNRLYAAGATGLSVFDILDPEAPQFVSSQEWFTNAPLTDVDIAGAGGFVYVMGSSALSGLPVCRIVDARSDSGQVDAGSCPFVANKTAFANGFAYVNPNLSPAEYLDYAVYSLANPVAPALVGKTEQRWRAAIALPGALIVETFDGRIARLGQAADGALAIVKTTWSPDALNLYGPVRATVNNLAIVDLGVVGDGGERVLPLVDVSGPKRPSSAWRAG